MHSQMQHRILETLAEIEQQENVRVLFACESGSRAWGFPSANSDFDVRFIYVRSQADYLRLNEPRDVIERPIVDDLDINGWDLRKTLKLMLKSNPTLMEWLGSPIVYREEPAIASKIRQIAPDFYNPTAAHSHYFSMAKTHMRSLQADEVSIKKYFYALRPMLAMFWIEANRGPVPTEFQTMLEQLPLEASLVAEVNRLMELKKSGDELGRGPRIAILSEFLEKELAHRQENPIVLTKTAPDMEKLNRLFLEILGEIWAT